MDSDATIPSSVAVAHVQKLFVKDASLIKAFIASLLPDFHLVDDVLHEVFLVVTQKAESFRPGGNFTAWAFEIAKRKVLEVSRTQRRHGATLSPERRMFWQRVGFHSLPREYGEQSWAADLSTATTYAVTAAEGDEERDDLIAMRASVSTKTLDRTVSPVFWLLPGAFLGLSLSLAVWFFWPKRSSLDRTRDNLPSVVATERTSDSIAVLARSSSSLG